MRQMSWKAPWNIGYDEDPSYVRNVHKRMRRGNSKKTSGDSKVKEDTVCENVSVPDVIEESADEMNLDGNDTDTDTDAEDDKLV